MRWLAIGSDPMYVQYFVKGIGGADFKMDDAFATVLHGLGIISNWWRATKTITPADVQTQLTDTGLDRHIHDYQAFGPQTPFISLACGCVERDVVLAHNRVHSAVDTALEFATDAGIRPGALYYGWVVVGQSPAVGIASISEAVRELNVYRRWSPFQPEGEVTAKVHVPANQISRVEWWDPRDLHAPQDVHSNTRFVDPGPLFNVRDLF
ncbi:hypothetical protein ACE7GA_01095 [Roseomonas sp. CCTCC AB2023176]|uniref:hypothetical protein n=1 Tax=Roseomonas sp. CCTCC AB2023176 TaxID=3342640 RepID=UPI0035D5D480